MTAARREWEADVEQAGTEVGRSALMFLRALAVRTGNMVKPELAAVLRRDRLTPLVVVEVGRTVRDFRRELLARSDWNGRRRILVGLADRVLEAVAAELRAAAMRDAATRPRGSA